MWVWCTLMCALCVCIHMCVTVVFELLGLVIFELLSNMESFQWFFFFKYFFFKPYSSLLGFKLFTLGCLLCSVDSWGPDELLLNPFPPFSVFIWINLGCWKVFKNTFLCLWCYVTCYSSIYIFSEITFCKSLGDLLFLF